MYNRRNLNELIQQASISTHNDLAEKVILLRTCLNLTITADGKIDDLTRFAESYPTIEMLALKCKKLIITAHMGRPTGFQPELSLKPIFQMVQPRLLEKGIESQFVSSVNEIPTTTAKVCMVDNIRFNKEEESTEEEGRIDLINKLTNGVDYFVNDAFPDYRESVTTYYIATHLKSFIGPNFAKEVKVLSSLSNPVRPYYAIVGGAKLSDKLDILLALAKNADKVLIGGAMAYTFLKANGVTIGNSLYEQDKIETAKQIMATYKDKIILPIDHLISDEFTESSSYSAIYTDSQSIPDSKFAIDIGKKTIELYKSIVVSAKTILVNGPMGVFEWEKSIVGSNEIFKSVLANGEAYKILGGGDTIATVNKLRLTGFNHVSTGGGAMLAFLSKERFPTLDVILDQYDS